MKRGRIFVLVFVILLFFLALYFLFKAFSYQDLVDSQTNVDSESVEIFSLFRLTESQLENGDFLELTTGDIMTFGIGEEAYTFKILEINTSNKRVELSVNSFLFFSVGESERKKLDLNKDDYYDTLVYLDSLSYDKARISLRSIYEKRGVVEIVDSRVDRILTKLEQEYKIQLNLIILILLVFLVLLTLYIIRFHVAPAVHTKNMTVRGKASDAFYVLLEELNNAKNNKDIAKVKRLKERIHHLYKYMSDKDKKKYQSKIKNL
jgi:hypothetical protein